MLQHRAGRLTLRASSSVLVQLAAQQHAIAPEALPPGDGEFLGTIQLGHLSAKQSHIENLTHS